MMTVAWFLFFISCMARSGPIIIVDDDEDDQEIINDVLNEIGSTNKRIFFKSCDPALLYLRTTTDQPFIILCDINLPKQNGLDFKREIDEDDFLRRKSIPFIFFSTAIDQRSVDTAYKEMTVQGFFKKQGSMNELKKTLSVIIDYWMKCRHPNSEEE